jgi:hypothetical protein
MKRIFVFQKVVFLALGMFFLASCSALLPAPTATPLPTAVPTITPVPLPFLPPAEGRIIYEKPDGKKFAGTIHGQGQTAIILGNMGRGGEGQWDTFVDAVDKQKFTVVTFLRLSADVAGIVEETNIILQQLRDSGYRRVICIGASLGVTTCGSIADQPEMIGMVLIAGPNDAGSLANVTYPKLFIAGATDRSAAATQNIYDQAAEPKELVLFPKDSMHGTDLFYSSAHDEEFLKLLVDFINELP